MPQEQQVPVEGQSFQERQLDVPYDTRPKAIRNTALIADQQILELSDILSRHQQISDSRKAINEMFDAASNTQDAASQIQHGPTAMAAFQDGMTGARSDIIERYPNLDENTLDTLTRITDKKIQSFRNHLLVKQEAQNRADIEATVPETIDQMQRASDPVTRGEILQNGFNSIKKYQDAGAIDEVQAGALSHKLASAKMDADAYEMAIHVPTEFAGHTPESLGITSKRYYELTSIANGMREHHMKAGRLQFDEENNKFTIAALNGEFKDNPAMLEILRESNKISESTYRNAKLFVPPDDRAKNNLERILNDTPWDDPRDVQEFARNWITGNHTLSSDEHAYLMGQVQDRITKLGDPQARQAESLYHDLTNYGRTVGTNAGILGNRKFQGSEKGNYIELLRLTQKRLEHTKDFDTMYKAYAESIQEIDRIFHVGEHVTVGTKPGKPHPENFLQRAVEMMSDSEFP